MKKTTLIILALLLNFVLQAKVIYVSNSGDNTSGLSWANAYHNITSAIATATNGDEIWVAQGTYLVNNEASQLIYKEGVNVYGGFTGDETKLESRNSDPALTIISHKDEVADNFRLLFSTDLNEPTVWDGFTFDGKNQGAGVKLSGNCTLNNAVVKNCVEVNGSGTAVYMSSSSDFIPVTLSNSDILNNTLKVSADDVYQKGGAGVFVKSGARMATISNCNIKNNTIEGISASGTLEAMGAGIYIYEGIIKNCILDENHITNSANPNYTNNNFTGGAIAIVPEKVDNDPNEVLIEGCVITNSTSMSRGGAVVIDPRWSGQYHGNYTISKTIIANNKTNVVGGGILATAPTAQTGNGFTLNIVNSVIANNSSETNAGGGICINIGCILNITNTTIVNNLAGAYGGGGLFMQGTGSHVIKPTLRNVLFWGNEGTGRSTSEKQLRINGQEGTVIFCAIQELNEEYGEFSASLLGDNINLSVNNLDANGPGFISPSSAPGYGAEGALDAIWKLSENSICVDAGDDYIDDDIEGVSRPQGDYSDIGAYEYHIPSGFKVSHLNDLKAYGAQGKIVIENNANIRELKVYNLLGDLIIKRQIAEGVHSIQLPSNQIYLVKAGKSVQKVIVR